MNFGTYVRRLRQQANLTQDGLARKCGLSKAYINQLESAKTDPPTRQVCRTLARALAADENELWKYAFTARLEKWLNKEGFKRVSADLLSSFFANLSDRR
jgi:transcriptional regulator with XRE-family HTH domain